MNKRQRKKLWKGEYDPTLWGPLFTAERPTLAKQIALGFRYHAHPDASVRAIRFIFVKYFVEEFVEGPEMRW